MQVHEICLVASTSDGDYKVNSPSVFAHGVALGKTRLEEYLKNRKIVIMFLFFILLNLYVSTKWQLAFFLYTCATPYMVLLFKTSNIKYLPLT